MQFIAWLVLLAVVSVAAWIACGPVTVAYTRGQRPKVIPRWTTGLEHTLDTQEWPLPQIALLHYSRHVEVDRVLASRPWLVIRVALFARDFRPLVPFVALLVFAGMCWYHGLVVAGVVR